MSPAEDLFGRFRYKGYKPRKGQAAMIQHVSDNPGQRIYNGVLPTGYGKTNTAAGIYEIAKMQGRCNRLLIVVPTDTQREQYADSFEGGCRKMGISLIGLDREKCRKVDGEASHLRAHRENRSEIFITTIQAILPARGYFNDLMATGRWMLFCDEYHKLRAEAAWGQAIDGLNYDLMLGLTATPIRTDGEATVFGIRPPDVIVSFEEAFAEQAIRGVNGHIEHYFVDVREPDGTVRRLTTEEIGEERNFEAYQKARDLRMTGKYLAGILSSAHDCLSGKNLKHPGQHQMLVFAMSVAHAKAVSGLLNAAYGPSFSDWIGVGPDGRSDVENRDILRRYSSNQLLCLVQVDKAGEGFDNPKSSVLVFLNLLRKSTVKAVQQGGRGVRRNHEIYEFEDDICDMFASPDTEMAELVKDFVAATVGLDGINSGSNDDEDFRDKKAPTFFDIPPFIPVVADAEFDRSELLLRQMDLITQEQIDDVHGKLSDERLVASDEHIRRVIAQMATEKLIKAATDMQNDPETARNRAYKAVNMLAGNLARMRHGDSFDKTILGDYSRALHGEWKRIANRGHGEMFDEEYSRKYEWVQTLNKKIKQSGEVPAWLRL